jgi:hypothetical protein
MRYWFLPELQQTLGSAGFQLAASGACYLDQPLGKDCWYGWVLAEKS